MSTVAVNIVRNALNRARYVFMLLGITLLVGAAVFAIVENKTLFEGIWWAFVTGFTVGYGDLFPVSVLGRTFAMLYMFIVAVLWLFVAAHVVGAVIEEKHLFSNEEQERNEAVLLEIGQNLGIIPQDFRELPPLGWWQEKHNFVPDSGDADEDEVSG